MCCLKVLNFLIAFLNLSCLITDYVIIIKAYLSWSLIVEFMQSVRGWNAGHDLLSRIKCYLLKVISSLNKSSNVRDVHIFVKFILFYGYFTNLNTSTFNLKAFFTEEFTHFQPFVCQMPSPHPLKLPVWPAELQKLTGARMSRMLRASQLFLEHSSFVPKINLLHSPQSEPTHNHRESDKYLLSVMKSCPTALPPFSQQAVTLSAIWRLKKMNDRAYFIVDARGCFKHML